MSEASILATTDTIPKPTMAFLLKLHQKVLPDASIKATSWKAPVCILLLFFFYG